MFHVNALLGPIFTGSWKCSRHQGGACAILQAKERNARAPRMSNRSAEHHVNFYKKLHHNVYKFLLQLEPLLTDIHLHFVCITKLFSGAAAPWGSRKSLAGGLFLCTFGTTCNMGYWQLGRWTLFSWFGDVFTRCRVRVKHVEDQLRLKKASEKHLPD